MNQHVVIATNRRNGGHIVMCLHCGQFSRIPLPLPADQYIASGKAFAANHRNCPPPDRTIDLNQRSEAIRATAEAITP
jgi:hypothetical protein